MAKKNGNGAGSEFGILVEIRDQLKGVNTRLDRLTEGIDGVLSITGEHYRDLLQRMDAVEARLGITK